MLSYTILHSPVFSTLRLEMNEGDKVLAQPGAMQAMTPGFDLEVGMGMHMGEKRGFKGGFRSMFGGESFFTAAFTAKRDAQQLLLAPPHVGDVIVREISEEKHLMLARGAFLACEPEVSFKLEYAGARGFLATNSIFFLKTQGIGKVFLTCYGGLMEQTLAEGERFVVDNSNIVAFTAGMGYESVTITKSVKDSFLAGEGFIARFTGPGVLLYQTRTKPSSGLLRSMLGGLF